jgi:hypothetical protein
MDGQRKEAIGVAAALAALSIAFGTWARSGPLVQYLLSMFGSRLDLWYVALNIVRDFPLTGVGIGMENWFLMLPSYAIPIHPMLDLSLPCIGRDQCWLMHAHNFFLQTWAEQGIIGFIAQVSIVVAGFRLAGHYLRSRQGFRHDLVFGAFWSFCAFSVHSLVDSGPSSPALIGLWAALGLITSAGQGFETHELAERVTTQTAVRVKTSRIGAGAAKAAGSVGLIEGLGLVLLLGLSSLAALESSLLLGLALATAAGVVLASTTSGSHLAKLES